MSPWLVFIGRMLGTALLVMLVARLAERAGPFLASVVVTLPLFAGPSFYFLMQEQSPAFLAAAATYAFAGTGAVLAFTAGYVRAAAHAGLLVSLLTGSAAWALLALPLPWLQPGPGLAAAWCLLGLLIARALSRPLDLHGAGVVVRRAGWPVLLARAGVAGLATAAVSVLGGVLGARGTGLVVAFPITLTVSTWMLHRQYGGEFAAAMLAATQRTLVSYATFCLVFALLAPRMAVQQAFWTAIGASLLAAAVMTAVGRRARLRARPPE